VTETRAKTPRPLPVPTATTKFFWEAAKAGKLALQYDPATGRYQFWPRAGSVATGQPNLEWRIVSGRGHIYSYTVTHVPTPGFEDRGPYPIGLVELEEGVRIIANLVKLDPAALKIGLRVKVTFETLAPGISYFAFEPE
jgi:uncharacterized protein